MAYNFFLHGAIQKVAISIKANFFRRWLWLLIAMVVLTLPLTTLAQSGDNPRPAPVILTDQQDKYPLGLHLEILEDSTGQLTIDDVSSPAYDDQFAPSRTDIPNFGYTSGAAWVRFQVRNRANPATTWRLAVEEARLGYVDLYTPAPDGTGFARQLAGRFRPYTAQDVPYRYGVFTLNLPPDQAQTIYLRVQSVSSVILPLTLWSRDAFAHHAQTEVLILGLFYGAMMVMLGYNFFLFAATRDRSYLYLTLFIAGFGLNDAFREGLAQQYLIPQRPNLYGVGITATTNYMTAALFGVSFLHTKKRTPRLHRVLVAVILISPIYYVLASLGWAPGVVFVLLSIFIALLLVATGYLIWQQGHRSARYFLLAWLLFLGAVIFHNLTNVGAFPGTTFGQHSMRIGMALMVLLLSLAQADRINLLKAESEQANHALRNSEHRLRQFLEAMPVGVAVFDAATRLSFINQKARTLFNLPADVLSDEPLDLAHETNIRFPLFVAGTGQPYPPEKLPLNRVLQQGQPSSADDIEVHNLAQPIQLETWASPIFDDQGQLQYTIAAFQDITERKKLESELHRHRDQLEEMVAERTRQLSAFLDMTILASEVHTLPEVVDLALNRIIELCQCRGLALHLLNDDQPGLTLLTQRGLSATQQEQLKIIPLEPPLSHWLSQRQEPLLAIGPDKAAHLLPVSLQLDGFQVYMGAQLRARESILGILSYYRFTEQSFSVDEISLLVALAEQLAIIIENHRLRGHIEEIAVIAERQRLARDLHDSINQSLYSINLFTHAAREASEDEDPNRLADSLTRIESIALTALKEMRLLLYQLQPDVLAEKGLAEALHLRFDSVERRLGIEADYQVVGQVDLPPDIAEALYRAAMEALNNSLKHAGASHLTVRLTMNEPVIELEIIDDGRGFEPERVNGGMGLQNIRQRLEQLNGCLALSSEVGVGTTVAFAVSLDEEEVEQAREAIRQ